MSFYRVYGFNDCPHCRKAVGALTLEDEKFEYHPIESHEARVAFLDERGFTPPDRTFPRVYEVVEGTEVLIGGRTELVVHLNQRARAEKSHSHPAIDSL